MPLSFLLAWLSSRLYLGNNIYEAYALSYALDNYRAFRSQESLKTESIAPYVEALAKEQREYHNRFGRSNISGLSYWLREHLAIGRYMNRAGLWPGANDVDYEIDKAWARACPDHGVVQEQTPRTVFMPAYRFAAVNLDEPRIVEGLRITKKLLARMHKSADEQKTRMLVILLPSKETAYSQAAIDPGRGATFMKLVEMEAKVRNEILSTCQQEKIECVSIIQALSTAISSGQQVYPTSTDGHPTAAGYHVIASSAKQELSRLSW